MNRARVAVLVFPGTNSEEETVRALQAVDLDVRLVRWSEGVAAGEGFDAYVLPGGFAYEDRIRAGAVAAHDAILGPVIAAAERGRFVIGICNGAQVLLEAGLVPGTAPVRRPTAAFAPNAAGGRFRSVHTHVKLAVSPQRSPLFAGLANEQIVPAWSSHGDGRLVAHADELGRLQTGEHIAFVYCDSSGNVGNATPNGSALDAAGLINRDGNVLALMPHPERDAWVYQHRDDRPDRASAASAEAMLAPSGGIAIFTSLALALERRSMAAGR